MSARVGSYEYLDERGIKAWAAVPADFIRREMADDKPLSSRFLHALILWSWCGPDATEAVMRKDERGYTIKDFKGRPIHATLKNIADLLGVDKGNVTRQAQALIAQGSLLEGKVLRLVFAPPPPEPEKVVSTDNSLWNVAGVVVSIDNLPDDPEERAEAIRFLELRSTAWKARLLVVKTEERELLKQGLSARGILIDKKNQKNRRIDPSSSSVEPPVEPTTTTVSTFESLESRIVGVFVGAGKDNPTIRQMREALDRLPSDARAGDAFLETLQSKIATIRHPGMLPSVVDGFLTRWPTILLNLEIAADLRAAREQERVDAIAWAAAEAAHAAAHGALLIDPFPDIPPEPELEALPLAPPPTHERLVPMSDPERANNARETARLKRAAELEEIALRRHQLRKPAGSEHAESPAVAKARGAT